MSKILEILSTFDKEQTIKLGSASGFWYVGTAGQFCDAVSIINEPAKQYSIGRLNMAKDNLAKTIKNWPTPENYGAAELKKVEYKLTIKGYVKMLADWFLSVVAADSRVRLWQDRVEHYIQIQKREVKDFGPCNDTVDPGVVLVVIEGHEPGAYWTTDEAESVPALCFTGSIKEEQDGEV